MVERRSMLLQTFVAAQFNGVWTGEGSSQALTKRLIMTGLAEVPDTAGVETQFHNAGIRV
ncbi:hypothetical protein ES702_03613 [subsurface metagenome]